MSGSTFTLFVRCGIWYADVRTPSGKRKKVTTKAKTRRAAMQVALAMQEEGRFDDDDANPSFWSYVRDWWIWDKCPYVKESVRNGRRLTRGYVDMCRTEMLKYIDPAFHDRPLKEITAGRYQSLRRYHATDYWALDDGDDGVLQPHHRVRPRQGA